MRFPLPMMDEIKSASDPELLRLYRHTLLRNHKGRFDNRLRRIIAEIKRRNAHMFEKQKEKD